MILVTGATGHLGSAVINQLMEKIPADQIMALSRSKDKAQTLLDKGIHVKIGDFEDIASLKNAVHEINKVLLISTVDHHRFQQHQNLIDAAKAAGVKHIAYTSALIRDVESSAVKAHLSSHFQTEDYIKKTGLDYTIFRNSLYADIVPLYVGEKVFEKGIYLPAGNGKVGFALRREMGEAIANALLLDEGESNTYDLTGIEMYSFHEVAEILSEIAGKEIPYTNADVITFPEILKHSGVPDRMIMVASGFTTDIRNQQYEILSSDLAQLLRRMPKNLRESLNEIYTSKFSQAKD